MRITPQTFASFLFRTTVGVVFGLLALVIGFTTPIPVAHAADVLVTPAVLDGKGKQREILRYTVTLENPTTRLVSIYSWVTDLEASGKDGAHDLSGTEGKEIHESLTRWIELTRSQIDLLPGDKRELPVLVQVNLNAKPGVYHAVLHFSEGSNSVDAMANKDGTYEVPVNIEVLDDAKERLQLSTFVPDKNIFSGESASFNYRIENTGNRGVVPKGMIRIFDKKGEEIATVPANEDGEKIEPESKAQLASVWAAQGEFGKYKAVLDLEYGDRGVIQDTVYFWVLPWGKLLSYFLSLAVLMVMLALLFHSYGASGRRIVYAQSDTPDEYEEEEPVDTQSWKDRMVGFIPDVSLARWRAGSNTFDDEHVQAVSEFTEVRIPPKMTFTPARVRETPPTELRAPTRSTRASTRVQAKPPSTKGGGHTPTTLGAVVKKSVDPAHVIDLTRK